MRDYNTLDLNQQATKLRDMLILEIEDVKSTFEYELATLRDVSHEEIEAHDAFVAKIRKTITALTEYIGEVING
jgi:hypothetical protein